MSRTANLVGPRSRTGMVVLCLALTAGFAPLASAQDHKRALDGDLGELINSYLSATVGKSPGNQSVSES